MSGEILSRWESVSAARADAVALIHAESGERLSFADFNCRVDGFLEAHPSLAQCAGRIWAISEKDTFQWLIVFVAGLRVGAVLVPIESVGKGGMNRAVLEGLGVSVCFNEGRVEHLPEGEILEDTFLIKITSGSTGAPERICFTEEAMLADGRQIMDTMGIVASDVNYAIIPPGHSYGLGSLVMPFLMEGVSMVSGTSPFPQVVADEIERYACTVLATVPPVIKALAQSSIEPGVLRRLKLIVSAGSYLRPELARAFYERYGKRVHNFYGSSETGGICFDSTGESTLTGVNAGMPLSGVSFKIDSGHVVVQSAAVSKLQFPSGEVCLSDRAEIDPSGALRLLGRVTDLVKIGGKRIHLSEVEKAILALEDVDEVCVFARDSKRGEPRLVAVIQGCASADVMRENLLERLPEWKVPGIFEFVEQMPYTERGKIDRAALIRNT